MSRPHLTLPVLLLMVMPGLAAAPARDDHARSETTFELSPRGAIVLAATFDDRRQARVFLDTGSSHSAISETLARRLAARAVARTTVTSILGQVPSVVVRIEHLQLGGIAVEGLFPSVLPDRAIDEAGRVDGSIGQDVLATLRFSIDYGSRRITWNDVTPAQERTAARFSLTPQDGRFLIDAQQSSGGWLRLVPDSGAQGLVLFDDSTKDLGKSEIGGRTRASGVTGSTDVQQISLRELQLGPLTLSGVPAAVIPRGGGVRTIDGLLPLNVFARVAFDGPARTILLERR